MVDTFQFILVLQVEQYTKKLLEEILRRVQGMNEDLLNGQLPLG